MQAFAPASKAQAEPAAKSPASSGHFQTTDALPAARHDFSRISIHPSPLAIQTKLTVNTPGDQYEQEADRIAEKVMRMPEPQLQRKCGCGGSCSDCQKEHTGQEHRGMQLERVSGNGLGSTEAPPIVHEVLRSSGQP